MYFLQTGDPTNNKLQDIRIVARYPGPKSLGEGETCLTAHGVGIDPI